MNSRITPPKTNPHPTSAKRARKNGRPYGRDGFSAPPAMIAILLVIALVSVVTVAAVLPSMLSANPTANFTADSMTGYAPFTVSFRDRSEGDIETWAWDLGDGNLSADQNPAHTYAAPGVYTVSLTVGHSGKTSECVKTDFIIVKQKRPVANFTSSEHVGIAPLTVTFRDDSSNSPDSWKWDFDNDGEYDAFTPEAVHTYEEPGDYSVRLTVENEAGADTVIASKYVKVLSRLPVAAFGSNVSTGNLPLAVSFEDRSMNGPGEWEWDLDGDGDVDSTEQNPTFIYESKGKYTVTLTVKNSYGSDTITKSSYIVVTSGAEPVADFWASSLDGTPGLIVNFIDLSVRATSWEWDFGDGSTSTERSPSHLYSSLGTYNVTLTVRNADDDDSLCRSGLIWVLSPETEWHTFQGGLDRNGVTDEALPIGPSVEQKWAATVRSDKGVGLNGGIVAADGKIFCPSVSGHVSAYDAATGDPLWDVVLGDTVLNFMLFTPAYHDGVLYVLNSPNSSGGCKAMALNAIDGGVLWDSGPLVVGQPNTPVTYDEGRIYFGTYQDGDEQYYYCLNAATGKVLWKHTSSGSGYYWNGATIISRAMVFSEADGHIISLDKYSGAVLDTMNCSTAFGVDGDGDLMRSSVAYSSELGMIFWTWEAGYCLASGFDRGNGTFDTSIRWRSFIGDSSATPVVYGGRVYVGDGNSYSSSGEHFKCLDALTGEKIWGFSTEGGVQASAVITTHYLEGSGRTYIYFTVNCNKGPLYCVNDLGDLVWKYEPPAGDGTFTLQGGTPYDGWLYYGNDKGRLFAIGPS